MNTCRDSEKFSQFYPKLLDYSFPFGNRFILFEEEANYLRGYLRNHQVQGIFKVGNTGQGIHMLNHRERELMVEINEGQIAQVLVNLIENAKRFSPPKGSIEVVVGAKNDDEITLQVIDHGDDLIVRLAAG